MIRSENTHTCRSAAAASTRAPFCSSVGRCRAAQIDNDDDDTLRQRTRGRGDNLTTIDRNEDGGSQLAPITFGGCGKRRSQLLFSDCSDGRLITSCRMCLTRSAGIIQHRGKNELNLLFIVIINNGPPGEKLGRSVGRSAVVNVRPSCGKYAIYFSAGCVRKRWPNKSTTTTAAVYRKRSGVLGCLVTSYMSSIVCVQTVVQILVQIVPCDCPTDRYFQAAT